MRRALAAAGLLLLATALAAAGDVLHATAGDAAGIARAFDAVFRAEAGRWEGSCRTRDEAPGAGWVEIEAVFDITHDASAAHPHAFSGRYGDTPISGAERIEEGHRRGAMRTPDGEQQLDGEVLLVHYEGAESYTYREASAAPAADDRRLSWVTRMGDRQINLQWTETAAGAELPFSFCSYRRVE